MNCQEHQELEKKFIININLKSPLEKRCENRTMRKYCLKAVSFER